MLSSGYWPVHKFRIYLYKRLLSNQVCIQADIHTDSWFECRYICRTNTALGRVHTHWLLQQQVQFLTIELYITPSKESSTKTLKVVYVRLVLCLTKQPLIVCSTQTIPHFKMHLWRCRQTQSCSGPISVTQSYALVAFRDKKRARTRLRLTSQPSHRELTVRKLAERIEYQVS